MSRLDDSGRRTLQELGITDVVDLRSREEAERAVGAVPEGVTIHLLPFVDLIGTEVAAPHESGIQKMMAAKPDGTDREAAAERFMVEEYQHFAVLDGTKRAVREVFELLGSGRSVITHCFAGKDRTGFTVAVVLEAIGVPREAVLADFMRSNEAIPELRERMMGLIRDQARAMPQLAALADAGLPDGVLGVREKYWDAARETIDDQYGSLEGFLRAADISAETVRRVQEQLTV